MAERFRFGVVGLASSHVDAMIAALEATGRVDVIAAADPDAALHGVFSRVPVYASADRLFDAERLDGVLVACDNAAKEHVVSSALSRGIAVYQDKSLAIDGDAGARILAARAGETAHMVAYHTVFDPGFDEFAALVRAGVIGEPVFGRGLAGHAGFASVDVSPQFEAWLTDPHLGGGGSFIDQAGYPLTMLTAVIGRVTEVIGLAGALPGAEYAVEQNTVAALRFSNGALGQVDTRWGQHGPVPVKLAVHGTLGTASWYPDRIVVHAPTSPGDAWTSVAPGHYELAVDTRRDYTVEAAHIVAAMTGETSVRPEVSGSHSLHVQRVMDAYYESVRSGRRVPVTE